VHESDEVIERVATALRRDVVALAPDFDARVMALVREERRSVPVRGIWAWMTRPRMVRVTPIGALALAAGLAGVVALAGRNDEPTSGMAQVPVMSASSSKQMMEFVFVAPSASSVAIVGDFNDWEEGGSPMRRKNQPGVWTITIPLAPGRYHYTFVVDGTEWVADPLAPRTMEDDFGRPNSVITVGEATT
jgi:hypothetical protein